MTDRDRGAERAQALPERDERALHAYHDGELRGFARWRFERRLARSPALQRELRGLSELGRLLRERCRSQLELLDQMSLARMDEAVECVESLIRTADEVQSNKIAHDALGPIYSGETTDGKILAEIINLAEGIAKSGLPEAAQTYLFSSQFDERISRLHGVLEDVRSAAENVKLTWSQFQQKAAANETRFFGAKIQENEVTWLLDRLRVAITNQNDLATWIEYCRAWKDCNDVGLMPLLDAFEFQFASGRLRKAFDRVYYRSLARVVFERYPDLTRMRGVSLRQARERFQELDRKILQASSAKSRSKTIAFACRSGAANAAEKRLHRACADPTRAIEKATSYCWREPAAQFSR